MLEGIQGDGGFVKHDWSHPVRDGEPEAGCYKMKLVRNGPWCAIRIWYGAPPDPDNPGELLDRSHRWQASINGWDCSIERVWPYAAGKSIHAAEYAYLVALSKHAKEHAPEMAEADPSKPIDPLTIPVPF